MRHLQLCAMTALADVTAEMVGLLIRQATGVTVSTADNCLRPAKTFSELIAKPRTRSQANISFDSLALLYMRDTRRAIHSFSSSCGLLHTTRSQAVAEIADDRPTAHWGLWRLCAIQIYTFYLLTYLLIRQPHLLSPSPPYPSGTVSVPTCTTSPYVFRNSCPLIEILPFMLVRVEII